MNRPGGIERAGAGGHCQVVRAKIGFVAERPHNDARVILVAVNHALHPVHAGGFPTGVVGRIAGPAVDATEAVGFQVALVNDVEAVVIAEIVKARVIRVMRGADGIDVMLLHQ